MTGSDHSTGSTEQIEVGRCDNCGEVESDGGFEFKYGPICPQCGEVLTAAWMEERPANDGMVSDTTADDLFGDDLR